MEPTRFLTTVISGGQDGADIAALRAAKRAGLHTGGVAPKNFWTMHGTDRTLHDLYGLTEIQSTGRGTGLIQRSQANVDRADATLAIRLHASAGTDSTIGYAETGRWAPTRSLSSLAGDPPTVSLDANRKTGCPVMVLRRLPAGETEVAKVLLAFHDFVQCHRVRTLNVCGHRDADEAAVEALLVKMLVACNQNPNATQ